MKGVIVAVMVSACAHSAAAPTDRVAVTRSSGLLTDAGGIVTGTMTDVDGKTPLEAATIVLALAPGNVGSMAETVALSDREGHFWLTAIPPGRHYLVVYYNTDVHDLGPVDVRSGDLTILDLSIRSYVPQPRHVEPFSQVDRYWPLIDPTSTQQSITLTGEQALNMPRCPASNPTCW